MSACDFCDAVILSLQKIKDRGTVQIVMPRRPVIDAHVLIMPLRHVERVDQLRNLMISVCNYQLMR